MRVGHTLIQSFELESKIVPGLKLELDFVYKLTEMNSETLPRLEKLSYDPETARKETKSLYRCDPLAFRCMVFGDEIQYDCMLGPEEYPWKQVKECVAQMRAEEALSMIQNPEYRDWLREQGKQYTLNYEDIVIGAPISIHTKIKMLDDIDKGMKNLFRYPDRSRFHHIYRKAMHMASIDTPVSMYVLHEKTRGENVQERVLTFRTFDDVLDSIIEKYHGEEADEFECRWNYVERFDLTRGEYKAVAYYIVSEEGVVWHASVLNLRYDVKEKEKKRAENELFMLSRRVVMATLDLPVPYKPGDIVTMDCRPFCEPYHAMIMDADGGEFTFSPLVLYHKNGWGQCWIHQTSYYREAFSPYYRMELFSGELPEHEKMLGELSKAVKHNPDLINDIYRIVDKGDNGSIEDELQNLIYDSKTEEELK